MRWLDSIINLIDMNVTKTPGDKEGQGSLTCSHRVRHNLATEEQCVISTLFFTVENISSHGYTKYSLVMY